MSIDFSFDPDGHEFTTSWTCQNTGPRGAFCKAYNKKYPIFFSCYNLSLWLENQYNRLPLPQEKSMRVHV